MSALVMTALARWRPSRVGVGIDGGGRRPCWRDGVEMRCCQRVCWRHTVMEVGDIGVGVGVGGNRVRCLRWRRR